MISGSPEAGARTRKKRMVPEGVVRFFCVRARTWLTPGVSFAQYRGMMTKTPLLALAVLAVLLAGCGSKRGDRGHPAQVRVDAVRGVLSGMAGALNTADADALAALWREDKRPAARERIAQAFQAGAAREVHFTLLGVRVEDGRMDARVTWDGVRAGEPVAGTFMLELEEGPPVRVVGVSGSDPVGGGAAQVEVPAGALR